MNYKVSFQELAILQKELLSKQLPTTLENAKKQVQFLKSSSNKQLRKKRP